ncbi:MAG: carboxypeptidase-like regulatory domain-containing protein [Lachnospiraceae bacterium]|nr:carboxypeptidase-like regulatory domain-containing protein [Lachnospiraceae bacterium]
MYKRLFLRGKQCLVFTLLACFLLSAIAGHFQVLKTYAASGDTYFIEGMDWNSPMDLYDAGYLRDFTFNGGSPLVLNDPYSESDTFSIAFSLPTGFLRGTIFDPQFLLLPATSEDPEEAFVRNIRLENQGEENDLHRIWYTSQSTVFDGNQISFSTNGAYFSWHEMFYVDENLNDVYAMSGDVPPSGSYYLVCLFYDEDILSYASGVTIPASFFIAEDPVYIDNPAAPAGENTTPPDAEPAVRGEKVTLDVSVYAGDTMVPSVDVIAYSSRGVCFGYTPCTAYAGEKISLSITPTGADEDLQYAYLFPSRKNGSAFEAVVPEDGHLDVYLEPLMSGITLSGHVYDENGSPVAGATVSCSARNCAGMSFSSLTNSSGFYRITDITAAGGLTSSASKKGYTLESYTFPDSSVLPGASLTHDYTLPAKAQAFTLKITGPADADLIYSVANRCTASSFASVKDPSGRKLDGDFVLIGTDQLAFYPAASEDISDVYTLQISSSYFKDSTLTLLSGQEGILTLNRLAGIHATASTAQDLPGTIHLLGFTPSGASLFTCSGSGPDLMELFVLEDASATISLVGYSDELSSCQPRSLSDLPDALLSGAYSDTTEIASGTITDLGQLSLPYLSSSSFFLDASYFTASGGGAKVGDTISVSGHLASSKYDFEVTALRVYAWNPASSSANAIVTASFKENSLIINGKTVPASLYSGSQDYWNIGRQILLPEPVKGPLDFSCKLETLISSNMEVVVEADIVSGGSTHRAELIGTQPLSGSPISLKTPARTASGVVKCSGNGLPDQNVSVWAGNTLIGSATCDPYGFWNLRGQIPVDGKNARSYRLHATCGGYSTKESILLYDPASAACEQIYMTENGKAIPDSYVWTPSSSFSFEAVVDNPSSVRDDACFYAMCSDGSVISLAAHPGRTLDAVSGISRQVFVSDPYSFGEKGLLPTKTWLSYSGRTSETKTYSERAPLYPSDTPEFPRDHISWETVSEQTLDRLPTPSEIGTGMAMTTLFSEISSSDFASLSGNNSNHMTLYGDDQKDLYEVYISFEEDLTSFGIYDMGDKRYYRSDTYFYDASSIPAPLSVLSKESGNTVLLSSVCLVPNSSFVEGINYANDAAMVLSKFLDPTGTVEFTLETGVEHLLRSSPKTAPFASVMKYVGIGDLINLINTSSAGFELRQKTNALEKDLQMLAFLEKYENLLAGESDVNKALGSVNLARSELDRAMDFQRDYIACSLELGLVDLICNNADKVGGPTGAFAKAFNALLGPIKNAMMDAIKAMGADSSWAEAQGTVTEAKLKFIEATGLNHEQLMEFFAKSEEGVFTDESILKMIRKAMNGEDDEEDEADDPEGSEEEDEEEFPDDGSCECEDSEDFVPIIDPSGFVYEAVASNRISGAVVTLYGEGMVPFDAEHYEQVNPVTSDAEGHYAWDVPEGNWYVQVYLPDYEEASSQFDPAATVSIDGINYLPVLPPQLDVNIPVMNMDAPQAFIARSGDGLYLVFDKYMQEDTVLGGVTFTGLSGDVTLVPVNSEVSPAHTPVCGGMTLATLYEVRFSGSPDALDLSSVSAALDASVLGYNGVSSASTAVYDPSYVLEDLSNKTPSPQENPDRENLEEQTASSSPVPLIAGTLVLLAAGGGAGAYFYRRKKRSAK